MDHFAFLSPVISNPTLHFQLWLPCPIESFLLLLEHSHRQHQKPHSSSPSPGALSAHPCTPNPDPLPPLHRSCRSPSCQSNKGEQLRSLKHSPRCRGMLSSQTKAIHSLCPRNPHSSGEDRQQIQDLLRKDAGMCPEQGEDRDGEG